jgi:hypothetical protein
MAVRIQFRRGTASQWTSANPVLAEGELGYETDTSKFKIGNGSTAWNSLNYGFTQISASSPITYADGVIGINQGSIAIAQSQVTNLVTDLAGKQNVVSGVSDTEIGYLDGVTSAIQTQIDGKLSLSGGTLTGSLTLNADPSQALQAATKQYVDAVAEGLHVHASVAAASTANIDLATGGLLTIDGVELQAGNRVLVKNQSSAAQNGIYVVASGAWTRATDYDSAGEIDPGDFVFVSAGTLYDSTGWVQTNAVTTLGTDPISWSQFSGAGTYTAGTGITLAGNQFSADTTVVAPLASPTFTGTVVLPSTTSIGDVSSTEIGYLDGVTSAIQTQINAKANTSDVTTALSGKQDVVSGVSSTEIGYLDGVTSAIQTQLDGKLATGGTAVASTNIAGGGAGQIPYQSAASTTLFVSAGSAGQVLTSNGTSAPTWSAPAATGFNAFLLSGM